MFQDLSKAFGIIFTLLLMIVLVIFGTAFYVSTQSQTTAPIQEVAVVSKPAVELTDVQKQGKELFNTNCASCHKRYKKATGPALHGVTERREKEWLYKWIKNSSALIASGDPTAVKLYNEWNQSNMNAFPQLSNEQIDAILAYVEIPK
ncbi:MULTISPECIES: cytochrome c [Nonlabens]|uniref:cytochrome c n=1 Tax=Nonlabens TaxID=363408 RepID=UPI0026860F43|nr:cytochrome c [Nonlabens tegetincola]